jgi:hypothetical protein
MIFNRHRKTVSRKISRTKFRFERFFFLELIKCLLNLQQQHQNKIAQMDQTHHKALKRLEMQILQKQQTIDRDSP